MGVRIIEGRSIAALYDSTTGIAFGPTFSGLDAHDQAAHFLDWIGEGVHTHSPGTLAAKHSEWAAANLDPDYGELNSAAARHVVTLL